MQPKTARHSIAGKQETARLSLTAGGRRIIVRNCKRWLYATIVICFTTASCVHIPQREFLMSQTGHVIPLIQSSTQDCLGDAVATPRAGFSQVKLDSSSIEVLNWNILKGDRRSWKKDFKRIADKMDLLLIQEAYLNGNMLDALKIDRMGWIFSPSFFYAANNVPTGVLTASFVEPIYCRALRATEPILRTPKSSLITKYKLSGSNQVLLVANVHAINFALGTISFRSQAHQIKREMQSHNGPIILSGDFNTWSANRLRSLQEIIHDLHLQPVHFKTDHRTRVFGKPIDHIFYRGLEVKGAKVIRVRSSDHNPMIVSFKLAPVRLAHWSVIEKSGGNGQFKQTRNLVLPSEGYSQ
jgi:endonuclease/exonuclease/phosphatase (EEP) superfamily protein YafD